MPRGARGSACRARPRTPPRRLEERPARRRWSRPKEERSLGLPSGFSNCAFGSDGFQRHHQAGTIVAIDALVLLPLGFGLAAKEDRAAGAAHLGALGSD